MYDVFLVRERQMFCCNENSNTNENAGEYDDLQNEIIGYRHCILRGYYRRNKSMYKISMIYLSYI